MGIQFKEPLWLLLFLPIIGYVLWSSRGFMHVTGKRRVAALSLRSAVLLMFVAALAGTQWVVTLRQKAVFYVVDQSASMPGIKQYESWLQASAEAKEKEDTVGIVATGLESVVERSMSTAGLNQLQLTSQVNEQYSNLAQGLQLAAGLMPDESSSRIVLVTDGQENAGDVLRQGRLLKDKGIPVDVLHVPATVKKDIAVESIRLPQKLYQAEKYALEIRLFSTFQGTGELRVYEDTREISREKVAVEKGKNRFALQSLAKEPGFHRYRAEIYFAEDEQGANNMAYSFSRVTGPPKVLIVEGTPGTSGNLEAALRSGLVGYDVILAEMLPKEMSEYTSYDSIVLNNASADRISEPKMEMLERAVRDYGIGLVMMGGEDSYGLGGYFKTPIEKALPVSMELEGKREIPSLGLLLVIDHSGSMGGEKMELAKEAAMRTVELLREKDTVGVVAFDSTPWLVVEPQKLTDRKKVLEQIQSIQPTGGTEIYTAVEEGFRQISKVEAQRRHIILLTDGQSATNQSYERLTADMVKNNITLSSVAVGDGADTRLLEYIAKLAKGRYYFTNDQTTLPAIFSREAIMMSRTYIVDQPFVPALGSLGDWAGLFDKGTPRINAYVAASAKNTAEVILSSPEPDPLLARWQYGSGRTVTWTSDITGKWSRDWVSWNRFSEVFTQIIKWTFPQFQAMPIELTPHVNGSEVQLEILSTQAEATGSLRVSVTDESLQSSELTVTPTAPGEYEAKLLVAKPGVYLTKIEVADEQDPSKSLGTVTTGFAIPYSPEYRIAAGDALAKLKQLAEITGGRMLSLDRPEEVFQGEVTPKRQYQDLSSSLLILALLLWLADIAVRRLSFSWERLAGLFTSVKDRTESSHAKSPEVRTAAEVSGEIRKKRVCGSPMFESTPSFGLEESVATGMSPVEEQVKAAEEKVIAPPEPDSKAEAMNRLLAAKKRMRR